MQALINLNGKPHLRLKPIDKQIDALWSAVAAFKQFHNYVDDAKAYAESIKDNLPEDAAGLAAFIWCKDHGALRICVANDVWRKKSERSMHTSDDMRFFRMSYSNFPLASFERIESTNRCMQHIASIQKGPIIVLPIRLTSSLPEEPLLNGEFHLDLTSGIFLTAVHSEGWQQEQFEFACRGEVYDRNWVVALGYEKGEKRVRTIFQDEALQYSLTAFVI